MIGSPSCGKSSLAQKLQKFFHTHVPTHNYTIVNQDTLKTLSKCKKTTEQFLTEGKSVIIDNTNKQAKTRSNYINIAKKFKLSEHNICTIYINTPKELSMHLNNVRVMMKKSACKLSDVVYHVHYKNLEPPQKSEGFGQIITTTFLPDFSNQSTRNIFNMKF